MKFGIENLGSVKKADVNLGDLTIICGKNNRGKTYFTYTLYSLLSVFSQNHVFPFIQQSFEICCKEGFCKIDVRDYFEHFCEYLNAGLEKFVQDIPALLALSQDVESRNIRIYAVIEEQEINAFIERQLKEKFLVTEKCSIVIEKKELSSDIEIHIENLGERLPRKENLRKMFDYVCSHFYNHIFPDAFSLTGERSGISIFADNIADFSRKISDVEIPPSIVKKQIKLVNAVQDTVLPFPLPIMKELEFFQKLKFVRRKSSFIYKKFPDFLRIADKLFGGHYDFDDQAGIMYFPEDSSKSLMLLECSSSVKSLVEFSFYLRHCAQKHQFLMIDEPELNLHPDNQRKLARLLAMLVNAGVRVLITTHSDYIIRELNTLITLKQDRAHLAKIKESEGYSNEELLDASKVKAYVAQKKEDGVTFEPAPVSQEDGIVISSLDEVIDKMNQIQDAIIWGAE